MCSLIVKSFLDPLASVLKRVYNDFSLKALHVVKEKTKKGL